jgi:hypothetical protein
VLSDAEVEVTSSEGLSFDLWVTEVVASVDIVLVRAVEIGRAGHVLRHELGHILKDLGAGLSGGDVLLGVVLGDGSEHSSGRWVLLGLGVLQLSGKLGVGGFPLVVLDHPGGVALLEGSLLGGEEGAGLW